MDAGVTIVFEWRAFPIYSSRAQACDELYKLERDDLNARVWEWATVAGWDTEMQTGKDGKEYRAFAPPR